MADYDTRDDDMANAIIVVGALHSLLTGPIAAKAVTSTLLPTDLDTLAPNQLQIELSFMKSPYRLTVERVAEP